MMHPAFAYLEHDEGPGVVGALLPEVSDTQARLDTLAADGARLDAAWTLRAGQPPITPEFTATRAAWKQDYERLKTFTEGSAGFTWSSDITAWQAKLVTWQGTLKSFDGKMVGPDVTPPTPPQSTIPDLPWWADPKVILPVAALGTAAYIFGPALKAWATGYATRSTAKRASP